jgi:hypothetical protein
MIGSKIRDMEWDWTMDAGRWTLGTGDWVADAGMLGTGHWIWDAGRWTWTLDAGLGHWTLDDHIPFHRVTRASSPGSLAFAKRLGLATSSEPSGNAHSCSQRGVLVQYFYIGIL